MTTGKTIALTRQTFVGKVMSLLFSMLSRLVISFLSERKRLLISWLQSPSAVILEPPKIKSVIVSISIHNNIWAILQMLEPPTRWEKVGCNQKVDDADSHLTHQQPIRRMFISWSHSLWTTIIKLLTITSRLWHSFEDISPHVAPSAGPSNKATFFYVTKTLSLRSNLVLEYRDQIQLQNC